MLLDLDPFGSAGPTVGISTSGFRLPKGKEERDDSKARKKKKKKSLWFLVDYFVAGEGFFCLDSLFYV